MKTLTEIKNTYAQERGYEDWEDYVITNFSSSKFSITATISVFEKRMDEICIRAQKAALENAYDELDSEDIVDLDWKKIHKAISNPENLIK